MREELIREYYSNQAELWHECQASALFRSFFGNLSSFVNLIKVHKQPEALRGD